jgi:hypothetical protein
LAPFAPLTPLAPLTPFEPVAPFAPVGPVAFPDRDQSSEYSPERQVLVGVTIRMPDLLMQL